MFAILCLAQKVRESKLGARRVTLLANRYLTGTLPPLQKMSELQVNLEINELVRVQARRHLRSVHSLHSARRVASM